MKLLAAACGVFLGVATVGSIYRSGEPHGFTDGECFGCHFTLPEKNAPGPLVFVEEISAMCTRCHEVSPLSHVVDVTPLIRIPRGMPLSQRGTLTCVTCHDPHTKAVNPATGEKTYFLRMAGPGKPFCLLCHEDLRFPGEMAIFSPAGGVTHRRSMTLSHGVAKLEVTDPFSELDPLSQMCAGCHDESEDKPDRSRLGMGIWDHGGGIGRSHPIGISYSDAAWNNRELVHERDLDRRIKLFDEKIGCCTCHDMYMEGGGACLVIGSADYYQELCFACHIK